MRVGLRVEDKMRSGFWFQEPDVTHGKEQSRTPILAKEFGSPPKKEGAAITSKTSAPEPQRGYPPSPGLWRAGL